MNILILCQRRCASEDKDKVNSTRLNIEKYIESIYGEEPKNYFWLCEGVKEIRCVDFHFKFDMFNYNTQNFVKTYKNFFDLVMFNTCPIPFFTPFDFFGIHSILKNKGNLLINAINGKKVKYETKYYLEKDASICPTPLTKRQIKLLFTVSEKNTYLVKKEISKNSYVPLVLQANKLSNQSRFNTIFNFFPLKIKNYAFYQSKRKKVKNLDFAQKIKKAYENYDKNHKDVKNIKIYSVKTKIISEENKKIITKEMSECFNRHFSVDGIFFTPGTWWILEYKGVISSFLLVDPKYTIWNVCTPADKRKKGFATLLFRKVIDEYSRDLTLTVIKEERGIKLIKFYNSLGFIYNSEISEFYELKRKEDQYIDLDLISIGPEEKIPYEIMEKHIRKTYDRVKLPILYYKDPIKGKIVLRARKILGSGSAGFVYLYTDDKDLIKVTVKQFFNNKKFDRNFDIESNISKSLKKKKVSCSIINSRPMENKHNKIIIMDYLPGRISDRYLSNKEALIILKQLTKILSCLYEKGFIMTDIASDNMLYSLKGNSPKLVLIDLGSFCEIGKKQKAYYRRGSVYTQIEDDKDSYYCSQNFSVWKLASFYLDLVLDHKQLRWWYLRVVSKKGDHCGISNQTICYDYLEKLIKESVKDDRISDLLFKMYKGYDTKDKKVITFREILSEIDKIIT